MTEKKWMSSVLGWLIAGLGLIIGMVIFIDPYFHFHKPWSFISYRLGNERYINDGISRNWDYDAVIVGNSMVENFKTSKYEELFGQQAVKIPYAGAGYHEIGVALEKSFQYNPNIKRVICSLDYNGMLQPWDYNSYEGDVYPKYLYDDDIFNDINYVLNKDVIIKGCVPDLIYTVLGRPSEGMDEYAALQEKTGRDVVLKDYDRPIKYTNKQKLLAKDRERIIQNIKNNFGSVIEEQSDTVFCFYVAPYSIAEWDHYSQVGTAEMVIDAEQEMVQCLLQYPNVEVHCFYNNYELVQNLGNYRDTIHYSVEISDMILKWIKDGTYRVTMENEQEHFQKMKDFYLNADYDSMLGI